MDHVHAPAFDASARSVTALLGDVNGGGEAAFERLILAVYDDLRRVAAKRMRREFDRPLPSLTESPTGIVHQAVLKLREQHTPWKDREHFFAIATRLIGYILADYKKQRMALKRGGGRRNAERLEMIDVAAVAQPQRPPPLEEELDAMAVIQALHEAHPRQAEVVTLRVLVGRSMPQIAQMIGVSLPTAERDWKFAKAWIRNYLASEGLGRDS